MPVSLGVLQLHWKEKGGVELASRSTILLFILFLFVEQGVGGEPERRLGCVF